MLNVTPAAPGEFCDPHSGELDEPDTCEMCARVYAREYLYWGREFGLLDDQGQPTGRRLRTYPGDPDHPDEGECEQCGEGHDVVDGRCVHDCSACLVAYGDGDVTPCRLGWLQ